MCLIFVAWQRHPRYPLVVAANRDEFHARATEPARWWDDPPGILAGRDLEAGGTWLGISTAGRLAAVTNYRDPKARSAGARSRGELVTDFLLGDAPTPEHLRAVAGRGREYSPFSLVASDGKRLGWCSNRLRGAHVLGAGVYGLSNHLLDTPWPKVKDGKSDLESLLEAPTLDPRDLMHLLAQREVAPDEALPSTGIGRERERRLSPRFVVGDVYGTRSSTVVLVTAEGDATFVERTFDRRGVQTATVRYDFRIREATAPRAAGAGHR